MYDNREERKLTDKMGGPPFIEALLYVLKVESGSPEFLLFKNYIEMNIGFGKFITNKFSCHIIWASLNLLSEPKVIRFKLNRFSFPIFWEINYYFDSFYYLLM